MFAFQKKIGLVDGQAVVFFAEPLSAIQFDGERRFRPRGTVFAIFFVIFEIEIAGS
jgi:hypothetical protein